MELRPLGRTGVHVSALSLGAMSFGALGNADHDDCVRIVHRALDAGINVVDTADVYSQGESEVIVGRALAGRRDDVVLTSKCFWPMGDDPNRRGSSRRWITEACEASLRRLGTDHLDVYYLHKPDTATDIDESLGAMSDLVRQGKVRAVGISTFPADLLVEAQWCADRRGHVRPMVEQPPYSVLARHIERDVLPACDRYGMGVLVWGPLNSGWLTGKYGRDGAPSGSRATRWTTGPVAVAFDESRPEVRRKHDVVDALGLLAAEAGLPPAHLALAFTLEHPAVSSTIIGPRTMAQLDDLSGAADVRLGADVLDAIDELVAPGTDVDPAADTGWKPPWLSDPGRTAASVSDGPWSGPVRSFEMPVERGTVEAFCRAIGQASAAIVPPTFVVVADRSDPEFPRRPPLGRGWADGPPETMLHVEQWIELHRPLAVGETVGVRRGPGRTWEREGRSGRLVFVEERTELVGADGDLRVASGWVDVRTEAAHRDLTTGQRHDVDRVERAVVPGRHDEVCVADAITVTQLVMYVGASGDLHPLHHDPDMARALGYPDVFAPGMLTMALTLRAVPDVVSAPAAGVVRVSSRFRAQVWPGDTLHVAVVDTGEGERTVRTRNQFDDTVLDSTITTGGP